jgi:hypothetical protein
VNPTLVAILLGVLLLIIVAGVQWLAARRFVEDLEARKRDEAGGFQEDADTAGEQRRNPAGVCEGEPSEVEDSPQA